MRTPKTLIAALGMSAFACGSAPGDLASGNQGVSGSSIAIHTMTFDAHQAKIGEFTAGYGVLSKFPISTMLWTFKLSLSLSSNQSRP